MKSLVLTLEVESLGLITWYMDVSYTVYKNYKGHSGGMMMMDKYAITNFSCKQ